MDTPEEIEFAWLLLIGTSITFMLALSIVIFLVMYQRRLFRQREAMEQLKLEEQERRLEAVLSVQEEERSRIALDLHDEVGALLSTVKLYMSHKNLKEEHQHKATTMLDDAVAKLRGIARNLSPENLQLFGLASTLEKQFRYLEEVNNFRIHFSHNLEERLPPEVELQLYRLLQELLNNTVKHAEASEVRIHFNVDDQALSMTYRDNGKGFDMQEASSGKSLGHASLASRVQILKGSHQVESYPGKGIFVTVEVPLSKQLELPHEAS
jgi:signal transduction histidine kinase